MQFEFMPGRSAIVAMFFLTQKQEKYHGKNNLYLVLAGFPKFFGHVLRKVIWWAISKRSIDETIVHVLQDIYKKIKIRFRVTGAHSDMFEINGGVHQLRLVVSSILFIIAQEALSRDFCTRCQWNLL